MTTQVMNILFLGSYLPDYSRNVILQEALKLKGHHIINLNLSGYSKKQKIQTIRRLKLSGVINNVDIILVPFPAWHDISLIKAIFHHRKNPPIIYDPLISLYDTFVIDRKTYPSYSFQAKVLFAFDKIYTAICDHLLVDTFQHKYYFQDKFSVHPSKISRVLVGARDSYFNPSIHNQESAHENNYKHNVLFYGNYVPLHGFPVILRAIKKVLASADNINFTIIGPYTNINPYKEYITNFDAKRITTYFRVPYSELPKQIANADVVLGIFGYSEKAQRVIPNKAYETLSSEKPLITLDTPGMREIFRPSKDFFPITDRTSLGDKIIEVLDDEQLRRRVAKNGRDQYLKKASSSKIAMQFEDAIAKQLENTI